MKTIILENYRNVIKKGEKIIVIYGECNDRKPGVTIPGHAREYKGDELECSIAFTINPAKSVGVWCNVTPSVIKKGEKVYFTSNIIDEFGNVNNKHDYINEASLYRLNEEGLKKVYCKEDYTSTVLRKNLKNSYWIYCDKVNNLENKKPFNDCFTINEEGVYYIEIYSQQFGYFYSNPILVNQELSNLIFGDPHVHSSNSDGLYSRSYAYEYAKNVSGLGFVSITDHEGGWCEHDYAHKNPNINIPLAFDKTWNKNIEQCIEYNEPNRFITLLGFEWTMGTQYPDKSGHRNVYYKDTKGITVDPNNPNENSLSKFNEILKDMECIMVPHHTGVCAKWNYDNQDQERLVEIYSTWGCSEFLGNDLWGLPCFKESFVQSAWEQGLKLGVIAGSDSHITTPGYPSYFNRLCHVLYKPGITGVYVDDVTRESLYNGMYNRYTYGTTGQKIILDFKVNSNRMGSTDNELSDKRLIEVFALGEVPIEQIEILRNNKVIYKKEISSLCTQIQLEDLACINTLREENNNSTYYYVRIKQFDDGRCWSSPIWFN